jgi:hypothetical protein
MREARSMRWEARRHAGKGRVRACNEKVDSRLVEDGKDGSTPRRPSPDMEWYRVEARSRQKSEIGSMLIEAT